MALRHRIAPVLLFSVSLAALAIFHSSTKNRFRSMALRGRLSTALLFIGVHVHFRANGGGFQ
jgi:hypothetical protein